MNSKEKASIISILVNSFLSLSKLFAGFISGSTALIADGIHSGLDILSSFVSFFGIRIAQKEKDEKHPYGFYSFENLASLAIVFLLFVSALWIIYEGIIGLLRQSTVSLSILGFGVVIFSILANEIIARYKFKVGKEENSMALIADAQHSRADVISSIGVLVGLILVKFLPAADGIAAILIGIYIIYESWELSRESIDQLVGVKDEEVEKEIKIFLKDKKIELAEIKSRKIGSASFVEMTIKLCHDLPISEAEKKTKNLQQELTQKITRLDQIIIQVESHGYSVGTIVPNWGKKIKWQEKNLSLKELGLNEKNDFRVLIPIKGDSLYEVLGAPEYLVIDKDNKKIINTQKIKNPYFKKDFGGGMKIIKVIKPDEIITPHIGKGIKQNAEDSNIKITIVDKNRELKELY